MRRPLLALLSLPALVAGCAPAVDAATCAEAAPPCWDAGGADAEAQCAAGTTRDDAAARLELALDPEAPDLDPTWAVCRSDATAAACYRGGFWEGWEAAGCE